VKEPLWTPVVDPLIAIKGLRRSEKKNIRERAQKKYAEQLDKKWIDYQANSEIYRLRHELADRYTGDSLKNLYVKQMKVKDTRWENVMLDNVELIIPVVPSDFVRSTIDNKEEQVTKNVELPDWNFKIYPYKIMLPSENAGKDIGENLFRWPKYQFHNEDLEEAYNIGKYLKWDGNQIATLEKKAPKKES